MCCCAVGDLNVFSISVLQKKDANHPKTSERISEGQNKSEIKFCEDEIKQKRKKLYPCLTLRKPMPAFGSCS